MTHLPADAKITWYFDFVSPFAYLQHEVLLARHPELAIDYRPVVFAGLLNHWDNTGPAEIVPKRTMTYQYCQWYADRHDIPMRFPPAHPFNPLPLLRLVVALDCRQDVVKTIYRHIYGDGVDLADEENWRRLLKTLSVDNPHELLGREDVKQKLWQNGEEAIALNIFGVPTIVAGKRCFWGLDATGMALDYLVNPDWFESDRYARLADLPIGKARNG